MARVKLPLIECVKSKDGTETFRRIDNGKFLFNEDVQTIGSPMTILSGEGDTHIFMNHTGKMLTANAVLKTERYTPLLCKAFYCHVTEFPFRELNCNIRNQ